MIEEMIWSGTEWIVLQSGSLSPEPIFTPGVTMPYYVPAADFSGAKNVGNLRGVTLTPYLGGAPGAGALLQLAAGTYSNIDFGDRRLDPRGVVVLNNCRITLTTSNYAVAGDYVVQRLNGSLPGLLTLNDCEIHNRAQRIMNTFQGRNTVMNRCVLTGGVDQGGTSTGGSAPLTTGATYNDCWLGDHGWWYYPTIGVVHGKDTQTHNDGVQVGDELGAAFNNCFLGTWPSEWVGTGTPNCGSDAGNPFVATYIVAQATMNGWRTTFLNQVTRADQSFGGISRKTSTGGSWAGLMVNRANVQADHCWFSGGGVQVNASDPALVTSVGAISVKRSTFWNDMSQGHSLTTTAKGTAIYLRSGRTYDVPTTGPDRNVWFDGTTVTPLFI